MPRGLHISQLPKALQDQIRKSDAALGQQHDGLTIPVARVRDIDPGGLGSWRCETAGCEVPLPSLDACERHSHDTGHLRIACVIER